VRRFSRNVDCRIALLFLVCAVALGGCGGSNSSAGDSASSGANSGGDALATMAAQQRSCIDALEKHLDGLATARIDAFLANTLNGLEVCDASYGFAHLPTRDVSAWLNAADGKPHANVRVPGQPAEIASVPRGGPARVRYQRDCIAWMRHYLPANIAKTGDDPDTAAADVFNGIEECDAVAGLATISRERLAGWVKAKNLN
jgi:hypothetical protein